MSLWPPGIYTKLESSRERERIRNTKAPLPRYGGKTELVLSVALISNRNQKAAFSHSHSFDCVFGISSVLSSPSFFTAAAVIRIIE
jgi:hypothetical protein